MHAGPSDVSDQVTVLVFKDNHASRTFHVPLKWISSLGVILGAAVGVSLLTSYLAFKYYRTARSADPTRVLDLEQELGQLKESYRALEAKAASGAQTTATAVTQPMAPSSPASSPVSAVAQSGAPSGTNSAFSFFTALPPPEGQAVAVPDPASLSFNVSAQRAFWRGDDLNVHFNILYTRGDGASQQGRIVILARGSGLVLAYPDGVLNRAGAGSLIEPDKGEYFSVSRFRRVEARFSNIRSRSMVQDVELLILNQEGQLLYSERLTPEKPGTPAPKRVETSAEDTAPQIPANGAQPQAADPNATSAGPAGDPQPQTATEAPAAGTQ